LDLDLFGVSLALSPRTEGTHPLSHGLLAREAASVPLARRRAGDLRTRCPKRLIALLEQRTLSQRANL
jgi:hypothetical protein